ncbi:MAG: hypothetical protein E7464_00160 [Ruminococcaceae bacterium]|nr:hypothetical protein [Oscillospiraceae bacterium]
MQKKRQISVILIVVMLLGLLAGCGKDAENTPKDSPVNEAAETAGTVASAPEADSEADTDESAAEEAVPDILAETETYYNEEFGFGFAVEGWSFYDEETLKAQTDANYVMAAANNAGETVSVAIQDTPAEYKGLTEEELYFLLLMTEQPKLQEIGMPDTSIEVDTTEFLGSECSALHSILGSVSVEQKRIYLVQDEQTCVITVTSANEEAVDVIMGLFHH